MQIQPRSLTLRHNVRVNVLKSHASISTAFDPRFTTKQPDFTQFTAIWDTGATNTFVSQKVVDDCALKPISITLVHTADQDVPSPVYLANLLLPNKVGFSNLRVARARITGADVLIGMDIINKGDFVVTNKDGKTTFSFRVPSVEEIDFVEESRKTKEPLPPRALRKVGRNAPCPCGSGKKYKNCCGR